MDLFSGSGSIAIEALSRGAKRAILVENSKDALGIIKDNIHFTKFEDESEIVRSDVISYLRRLDRIDADIIFIDPPYGKGLEKEAVLVLDSKKFKNEDAIIIIEARLDEDMSFIDDTGFVIYKTKNYKTNKHVFLSIRS